MIGEMPLLEELGCLENPSLEQWTELQKLPATQLKVLAVADQEPEDDSLLRMLNAVKGTLATSLCNLEHFYLQLSEVHCSLWTLAGLATALLQLRQTNLRTFIISMVGCFDVAATHSSHRQQVIYNAAKLVQLEIQLQEGYAGSSAELIWLKSPPADAPRPDIWETLGDSHQHQADADDRPLTGWGPWPHTDYRAF
jgi:hypothetical protein